MIKYVIHLADIHLPNSESKKPYSQMVKKAMAEIYRVVKEHGADNCRIVISGDIFHHKIKASEEAKVLFYEMMNYLNAMCKTIVIAGNHDMLENNQDRTDALTPTFVIKDAYKNIVYLDKALDYKSGCIVDDNIVWCLYSMFDMFKRPEFDELKEKYPDHRFIGLYHGDVCGATTDIGRVSESGIDTDEFKGLDCVMAGHVHKYQTIRKNGVPIVYAGSTFQQDMGENVTGHGFVLWNMEDMKYEHHEIPNDYLIYKFDINDYDDVSKDIERLINY